MRARTALILYNGGKRRCRRASLALERTLERLGWGSESIETPKPEIGEIYDQYGNRFEQLLRELDLEGYDCVIVVGGDGTLNDVINAIPQDILAAIPIALLGKGTVNVLSRALSLPRRVKPFARSVTKTHVVQTVPVAMSGQRRWIQFAESGFFADLMLRLNELTSGRPYLVGWIKRLCTVLLTPSAAASDRCGHLRVSVDGQTLEGTFGDVLSVRVLNYGGFKGFPSENMLADDKFMVLAYRQHSFRARLGVLVSMPILKWRLKRERRRGTIVHIAAASSLRIDCQRTTPSFVDAETHAVQYPLELTFPPGLVMKLCVPEIGRAKGVYL